MTEPAEDYIPIDLQKRFHTQAVYVWLATSVVVLIWVGLIASAPLFLSNGITRASSPIYAFFSYICHQIPERSLHLAEHQMAVCSRCFGVYFGLLVGVAAYPLWRRIDEVDAIPRFWLFLSLLPITIDWSLTAFGVWENSHLSRLVTGMILGAVCATYIVPALVEIVRNLTGRPVSQ